MDTKTAQYLLKLRGFQVADGDDLLMLTLLSDQVLTGLLQGQPVEIESMQAALLAKGIRIGKDDPIFVVLTLYGLVLRESTDKLNRKLAEASKRSRLPTSFIVTGLLTLATAIALTFAINVRYASVVAMLLGVALGGIFVAWYAKQTTTSTSIVNAATPLPVKQLKKVNLSEADLERACEFSRPPVDWRVQAACKDVLVRGINPRVSASNNKVKLSELESAVTKMVAGFV